MKIIRARNINAAEQGGYLAGDDFISGQRSFCPATVRALKASQAMGAARSDGGEVKFLWSVLAKHRLKLLQNKENKLYPSFGTGTA